MIAGEKNLRETVLQEGLIFHLIDLTYIFSISPNAAGAGETAAPVVPPEMVSTTRPASGGETATSRPTSRPATTGKSPRDMSPDERRTWLESLTPEQREALRKQMEARQGGSSRPPAGEGP